MKRRKGWHIYISLLQNGVVQITYKKCCCQLHVFCLQTDSGIFSIYQVTIDKSVSLDLSEVVYQQIQIRFSLMVVLHWNLSFYKTQFSKDLALYSSFFFISFAGVHGIGDVHAIQLIAKFGMLTVVSNILWGTLILTGCYKLELLPLLQKDKSFP